MVQILYKLKKLLENVLEGVPWWTCRANIVQIKKTPHEGPVGWTKWYQVVPECHEVYRAEGDA